MKLRISVAFIAVALLVSGPSFGGHSNKSVSKVWRFPDNGRVPFAYSVLRRAHDRVTMSIHTRKLPPGAYTVWWVVFNDTSVCDDPAPVGRADCGAGDIGKAGTAVF